MNDLKAAIDYTFVFLEDELADAKKKYQEAEQLRIDKENNPEKNWNWKWEDGGYWPIHHEAQAQKVQNLTTALTALREQMKRSEGCEWCHEYIRMDKNYCAECGRDLAAPTAEHSSGVEGEEE